MHSRARRWKCQGRDAQVTVANPQGLSQAADAGRSGRGLSLILEWRIAGMITLRSVTVPSFPTPTRSSTLMRMRIPEHPLDEFGSISSTLFLSSGCNSSDMTGLLWPMRGWAGGVNLNAVHLPGRMFRMFVPNCLRAPVFFAHCRNFSSPRTGARWTACHRAGAEAVNTAASQTKGCERRAATGAAQEHV